MDQKPRIIIDLDGTLTLGEAVDYSHALPNADVIERLRDYRSRGFSIVIHTSRNMRTFAGNVGLINVHTLPVILAWLARHEVPYDEVVVGKPWCGYQGFYVDDKTVSPTDFVKLSYGEICAKLGLPPADQ
jgi:capsule biosynthesis phosphatase